MAGVSRCPGFGVRAEQAKFYVLGTQWETKQKISKSPPLAEGKVNIIVIH